MPRILSQYERAIFTLFPNFLRITFTYTKPFEADERLTSPSRPKTREELHQLIGIKDPVEST